MLLPFAKSPAKASARAQDIYWEGWFMNYQSLQLCLLHHKCHHCFYCHLLICSRFSIIYANMNKWNVFIIFIHIPQWDYIPTAKLQEPTNCVTFVILVHSLVPNTCATGPIWYKLQDPIYHYNYRCKKPTTAFPFSAVLLFFSVIWSYLELFQMSRYICILVFHILMWYQILFVYHFFIY